MRWLLKYRWLVVFSHLAVTIFFAIQLPKAKLDNDVANFIPLTHPTRAEYAQAEESFGGQMLMVIAIEPDDRQVLSRSHLQRVVEITKTLEAVPYVDQVLGLGSAKDVVSVEDRIEVLPLLPTADLDEEVVYRLRERLRSWEVYQNSLINPDESAYQFVLRINAAIADKGQTDTKQLVYDEVRRRLDSIVPSNWKVYISGTPVFAVLMSKSMQLDLVILVPLVILVLTLTLLFTLKRLRGVVITLATVFEATIWSLGLMALLGIKLSLLATVIPVIMMAVGSAYAIHVISHVFDERRDPMDWHEVFLRTLRSLLKPVLLAALTTIAGFGSLAFTDILPMRDFGIFASLGVFTAALSALSLAPALLSFLAPRSPRLVLQRDGLDSLLTGLYKRLMNRPLGVIGFWGLILMLSAVFASRLVVDNALVEFFAPQSEIARSDRFLRESFAGTKTFSLVFEGPGPGSMTDPRVLAVMDETTRYLEDNFPYLGKALGFHHLVKRMNEVFMSNRPTRSTVRSASPELPGLGFDEDIPPLGFDQTTPAPSEVPGQRPKAEVSGLPESSLGYYEIPTDPAKYGRSSLTELQGIINDYLFLLGDSTRGLIDDALEPSKARINIQLRTSGNIETEEVKDAALAFARTRLPEGFTVTAVGVGLIEKAITDLIVTTQIANIFQSLAAVFLILLVSNRNWGIAVLGLFPLGLALPINFGLMGLFGIKLNIATSMVSSIAIGVGIDYTIHLIEALKRSTERYSTWTDILHRAFQTSGRAILINALSVGLGFLVLLFSQFQPLIYLGALIAVTMGTTSLASLTLVPALIQIFHWQRFFIAKN